MMQLLTGRKDNGTLSLQDTVLIAAQQQMRLRRCKFRRQT